MFLASFDKTGQHADERYRVIFSGSAPPGASQSSLSVFYD